MNPKLFISYCWSSIDHEKWVLNLATELRQSGVDAILDKWDLKEGHDSIYYMEQMVVSDEISKVLIISDKYYAEKADSRTGGVGLETQLISKEVYEKAKQDKFALILVEKKEDGTPYLPTYYKSRIFIDFTESENYAESFERLLRWIFDKPAEERPPLGQIPDFLNSERKTSLNCTYIVKRIKDSIHNGKPNLDGLIIEYFDTFNKNLELFRIENNDKEFYELFYNNLRAFHQELIQYIEVIIFLAKYRKVNQYIKDIHKFLESLLHYKYPPEYMNSYNDYYFDNFKFIIHELYIYTIAILLSYEYFSEANYLFETKFFLNKNNEYPGPNLKTFSEFRSPIKCFQLIKNNKRLSLVADLFKERNTGTGISFELLLQADFVIYLKSILSETRWFPDLLFYATQRYSAFEIFSRSESKEFYQRLKVIFNNDNPIQIKQKLSLYYQSHDKPQWDYEQIDPFLLLNLENIIKSNV